MARGRTPYMTESFRDAVARIGLGYSVQLRNVGPATASRVRVWLASPETPDAPVSATLEFERPLLSGESTGQPRRVIPLTEDQIRLSPPLVVVVAWHDVERRQPDCRLPFCHVEGETKPRCAA